MSFLDPRVRRTPQNIQCLYNLDRRVHAIKVYPILSPQGASIFLYGHENGITIVWRGGRRLKRATKADAKPASKSDGVMILDSDSDDASASTSAAAFVDKPVFEDAPPAEPLDGFADVQQTLDLALGTAVLHIAVLPLAPSVAKDAEPPLLRQQMVFAITCATADVYVVTLPLTPPSHESKERLQLQTNLLAGNAGHGAFGEILIPLGGQTKSATGVAMTLAKQTTTPASATASRANSGATPAPPTRVIVAAPSRESMGTLRLWDVTVGTRRPTPSPSAQLSLDRPLEPFQTEYLSRPLSTVAFNPTHPTQLLAVSPQDALRVYDYSIPAIPSDYASEGPFPSQGSWLLSLYPPFIRSQTASALRKPIVSAAWVAHGYAILVLLADGQWGIWDIDRPDGATGVLGGRSASASIRGAALTAFNISGQLEGTGPLRNPVASTRKSAEGEFVPMTPHTRSDALASTFSGKIESLVALRGGVEVVQQHAVRGADAAGESAVLWLGGTDYIVAVIPDVARFWNAQLQGSNGGGVNLFSGSRPARMIRLTELNTSLMGERCCGISAAPRTFPPSTGADEAEDQPTPGEKLPIEILVQGESRLVVVHENSENTFSDDLTSRLLANARKRKSNNTAKTAIVVERRPQPPGAVKLDLSLSEQASALDQKPRETLAPRSPFAVRPGTGKALFRSPERPAATAAEANTVAAAFDGNDNEVSFTQSMVAPSKPAADSSLAFAGNLNEAANASDDEEAANERNIEEEMLDIMELDQALEAMEGPRGTSSQNVFFEGE